MRKVSLREMVGKARIIAGGFAFDIVELELTRRDYERRCSFTLCEDSYLIRCGRKYTLQAPDERVFSIRIDGIIYTSEGVRCTASCAPQSGSSADGGRSALAAGRKPLLLPPTIPDRPSVKDPLLVLVVDDDEDIRVSLREIFESSGFLVESAPHGSAALQVMKSVRPRPSLVLLDLMMPEMDGWAFREAQKADPNLSDIPVVAITAAGRDPKPIDAELLLKPFDMDTLLRVVQRTTTQPRRTA